MCQIRPKKQHCSTALIFMTLSAALQPKKQRSSPALSVMKIRQKLCKMGYLLIKWDGFACWKPIGAPKYPVGVVFHKLCKALLEANFLLVWVQHFLLLSQFSEHWRSGIDEAAEARSREANLPILWNRMSCFVPGKIQFEFELNPKLWDTDSPWTGQIHRRLNFWCKILRFLYLL